MRKMVDEFKWMVDNGPEQEMTVNWSQESNKISRMATKYLIFFSLIWMGQTSQNLVQAVKEVEIRGMSL